MGQLPPPPPKKRDKMGIPASRPMGLYCPPQNYRERQERMNSFDFSLLGIPLTCIWRRTRFQIYDLRDPKGDGYGQRVYVCSTKEHVRAWAELCLYSNEIKPIGMIADYPDKYTGACEPDRAAPTCVPVSMLHTPPHGGSSVMPPMLAPLPSMEPNWMRPPIPDRLKPQIVKR